MYDTWLSRLAFWLLFNVAIAFSTLFLSQLFAFLHHTPSPEFSAFFRNGELYVVAFAITIEALAGLSISTLVTSKSLKVIFIFILIVFMISNFAGVILMSLVESKADKDYISQSSITLFFLSFGLCSAVRIWIKL